MDDDSCGFDELGADDRVGFDYGGLLQAAGGVAQYGISAAETEKKEQAAKADQDKFLKAAIAADIAAANAVAKADVSAQLKSASAGIDTTAAQMALSAQDVAGAAGLTAESAKKRADAADQALAAVVRAAQAAPKDAYKQALVNTWKATANKAHSTAIVQSGAPGSGLTGYGGESWFTRRVAGPLPGWSVLAIGAGVLTGVGLLVKKFVFSRAA